MNSTLRPHSLSTSSTLSSDTDCTENENIDVIGDNHKNDYNISGNNSVDYFSIDEDSIDRSLRGSPTRKRRLSSSGSHRSGSTEDVRELRSKINSRERKRMHDLNTAMDSLREIMPYAKGPSVRKLSKIATLSLAKNYIQMMSKTIEEMKQLLDDIYRSGGTHPAFNHGRIHPSPYLPSHHHSFTVMPPLSGTSHGQLHPVLHHTASHHPSSFTSHHHLSHQHHQNLLSTSGVNSLHPQNPSSQPIPASPPSSSSSADEHITTSLQTPHSAITSPVCATPLFQTTPCTCPGLGSYPISMLSTRPDSVVAYSLESNSKRSALL